MTMTDWNDTAHGVADAGEPSATPLPPVRTRAGKPPWAKILENDRVRALVAAHLTMRIAALRDEATLGTPDQADAVFVADQLQDVVTALRGT